MLQEMEKTSLKALHKQVDPPLKFPSSWKNQLVSILPGGINYGDEGQGSAGPLYQVQPDINGMEMKIQRVEKSIKDGLFNNLFLAIIQSDSNQMTAREVMERLQEKLNILGPFIERHQTEFHDPVINRTFNIMVRRGMLPPPPQEIMGQELKVEYISILAQAQKMVGTQAIRQTADFVSAMAQFKPDVLDKFDADEATDQFAEMVGTPANIIVSDDKVAEIRAMRQKQVEAQKQELLAQQGIDAAQKLSQTSTQPGNVVGDMAQSMGAEQ
jgi:hypothetical protein